MVNSKHSIAAGPQSLSIRYHLLDLPTAQHKAGLAGLLLQVQSMKARGVPPDSIPSVELIDSTTVDAAFTEVSLCGLFDDLYDAKIVEVRSRTRWPKKTPKRIEIADRNSELVAEVIDEAGGDEDTTVAPSSSNKSEQRFVYDVTQPNGHFLRRFTDDGKEIWHKLWRDMLWAIPRGKPTTRGPFNTRANGESSGEGEAIWKELLAMEKAKLKNEIRTCEIAGAILLGAQAVSAESVPFLDRVDQALLLHFWQLTVRVFVPEQVGVDGKRKFVGYVIAIPEVADLPQFTRRYTRALSALNPKPSGYYPFDAVISLPAQGALEFMDGLARLAGEATSADFTDVARALASVEFVHMVKAGNNIKTMVGGRVATNTGLLSAYNHLNGSLVKFGAKNAGSFERS